MQGRLARVLTVAIVSRLLPADATPAEASCPSTKFASARVVDRWTAHFRRNRENRAEPPWDAPLVLPEEVVRPLVRSLEQFQLGDGGGPACLIAWNAERFRTESDGMRELVDLWFAEEKEHSRLLKGAVAIKLGSRFRRRRTGTRWS